MTFSNAALAMSMLQVMERGDAPVHMMPIPRCISVDCGLSLRYSRELDAKVRALAARSEISQDAYSIYCLDCTDGKQVAEKL